MRSPAVAAFLPFLLPLLLATPALGQRPKTAEEAVARLQKLADKPESERFRAVGDVGDFADDSATQQLLSELQGAQSLAYRQAVIRALGEHRRPAAVPVLGKELADARSVRLFETVAQALAKQGDDGVQLLAKALANEKGNSPRANALCDALGRADGDAARDALLAELQRASGRDRLAPLRGLQKKQGDAKVDEQRVLLARDKDALVAATAVQQLGEHAHKEAATLALELARRAGATAGSDVHSAVLVGLLTAPSQEHAEPLLVAAARAEDPFAPTRTAAWQRWLAADGCLPWFAEQGLARKPASERAAAARALGYAAEGARDQAAVALQKALAAKEAEVVGASAQALASFGASRADAPLQKLLQGAPEPLQPLLLGALHTLHADDAAWQQQLVAAANGKGAPLRAAALQLLATTKGGDRAALVQAAADNLAHKAWPVRSAAIDLLRALREPAGVQPLFERLDLEQGRLQKDVVAALQDLTALQFPTTAAWRAWWQKEGSSFRPVAKKDRDDERGERNDRRRGGEAAPTTASYWNLPVTSERVVFIVDASGSMLQPFGTGDGTRLDEAKRQLVRVLAALPAKAKANVVVFSDDAKAFAGDLQTLDDKKKKAASAFADGIQARGPTNVHAGLRLALADGDVDTIFLLTDGQPSSGPVVDQDALLREVSQWNLGRVVRIHTVAIGGRSRFLERLAEQSGGEHTVAR
jgi:hypothetical protein